MHSDLKLRIDRINEDKDRYMSLLLIGDEQEDMVRRYLDESDLYVLFDHEPAAACAVVRGSDGTCEIKNISVIPKRQRQGLGRLLVEHCVSVYRKNFSALLAGTGDSPLTVPFYEKCGFKRDRVIKNFFTDNYDHVIIEDGVVLRDMVYFKRKLD